MLLIYVARDPTIPNYAESRDITAVVCLSEVSEVATKFCFSFFRRVSNSFIKDTHTKTVPNE